jgi:hypothetical protein
MNRRKPKPKIEDPQTPEEWQNAVDVAAAFRYIWDCRMYGLLEGGGNINVARCDELLERGRERGVRPSRPVFALAVELIDAINNVTAAEKAPL